MEPSAVSSLWLLLAICCVKGATSLGTPPTAGDWTAQDNYGNTCMRLSFAAEYIVNSEGFNNRVVTIGPASYAKSNCASPSRYVDFFPDPSNQLWKLRLGFRLNATNNSYAMTKVLLSWPSCPQGCESALSTWMDSDNFLKNYVPTGEAYTCADGLSKKLGYVKVYIWDMHLQPYAEDSGGSFGQEFPCGTQPKKSGDHTAIIISCSVAGGVVVLALVATVVAITVIKYRKRREYARLLCSPTAVQ